VPKCNTVLTVAKTCYILKINYVKEELFMASKEYQKLKEKIKKEYNDFAVSIEKLDKRAIIEKAKEIYIMQEVKMVFETENIFIPKEVLTFLMNDDINAIKELTEIILDAESVEFYCENVGMAIEEIQMKMES
jgi:predicted ribosome-associated RNA-binding protein Tma20